jgi:hypothetical protein
VITVTSGQRVAPAAELQSNRGNQEQTMTKKKFIIKPHFRLQKWVAEEKGYFREEGLDYVF